MPGNQSLTEKKHENAPYLRNEDDQLIQPEVTADAQIISAFVDGEIAKEGSQEVLALQLLSDPSSQAQWQDFHLIGDVMRRQAVFPQLDVSAQVADIIAQEPPIICQSLASATPADSPKSPQPISFWQRLRQHLQDLWAVDGLKWAGQALALVVIVAGLTSILILQNSPFNLAEQSSQWGQQEQYKQMLTQKVYQQWQRQEMLARELATQLSISPGEQAVSQQPVAWPSQHYRRQTSGYSQHTPVYRQAGFTPNYLHPTSTTDTRSFYHSTGSLQGNLQRCVSQESLD